MVFAIERIDKYGDFDLRAAIKERVDRVEQIRAAAPGDTLANVTDPDLQKEVKKLMGEVEQFEAKLEAIGGNRPSGYRPHAISERSSAGRWSSAFVNQLTGSEFTGSVSMRAGLTPSGAVTVPSLSEGIVPIDDRPQRLLDVVPVERLVDTDQYAYLREVGRTHAAAETAPGALKPTSTYAVTKIEDNVRVIAHVSEPVDRFALEDTRLLADYLDGSMRQGVHLRLDAQIVNGSGLGENLTGLGETPDINEQPFATDLLTTTRKALTTLEGEEIPGGVFVLSAAAWEELELATVGANESYALDRDGSTLPVDRAQQRLWGQPVIVTSAVSGAEGYLVDFAGSTRLYERNTVRVDWSEAPEGSVDGESAFKSNELVFRAEGRFGFAVLRPRGIVRFETVAGS